MSITYAPRHAPPRRLTPVLLAGLDAVVLVIAVLAVVLASLALARTAPGAARAAASITVPAHAAPAPRTPQRPAQPRPARVTRYAVHLGDSLWSIAGAAWPRVYSANRTVIGSDPGIIRPGEILVMPVASR